MTDNVPATPCPPYEWDEDEAYRELEELARQEGEQNAAIRALLRTSSAESKEVQITVGDESVTIRIHAVLPYVLRAKVVELQQKMYEIEHETDESKIAAFVNQSPVDLQKPMYEILAALCIDPPFTEWGTWAVIDQRTSRAPYVLEKLMEAVNVSASSIGRFRGK